MRGVRIGSAVRTGPLQQDERYRDALRTEFGSVTPEDAMKWARVEPQPGQYRFEAADAVVDFAGRHGQFVRGHTLVWHRSVPSWLTEGGFTAEQVRGILRHHIEVMVSRYAGRVGAWDVVNEAFNEDGTLRGSFWLQRLGPGYIADAFRWAHAADPSAALYLNDFNVEWTAPKSNALHALVRDLRAQGVPVHGVGLQSHVLVTTPFADLARTIRRFADLGVDVALTELDVRMPLPVTAAKLADQAGVYSRGVRACLSVDRCRSITVWGFTDAHSWVPESIPGWGAATVTDETLRHKPAYCAVYQALADRASCVVRP